MIFIFWPLIASAETWITCETSLHIENGVYTHTSDHFEDYQCKVWFWPIKNPVGLLECDNQSYIAFEKINENEIRFGDYHLIRDEAKIDPCTGEKL
jgi:hypothetical protein